MSIIWHSNKGDKISCVEKIKVMEQNFAEIKVLLQDLIDDGVLMGISEQQIKEEMIKLIKTIKTEYNQ